MNILHHKSWHVRNKNNIAKVRAAEKKAREEEEAKEKRKLIAESEARVNLLRVKARAGHSGGDDATISSIATILGSKEPSAVGEDRHNEDHAKEVKKDREEWEKKVGILTYLGQGCSEDNPWYLLDHNSRMKLNENEPEPGTSDKPKGYIKSDPMIEIEKNLATMKKNKQAERPSGLPSLVYASPPVVCKALVKQEGERSQKRTKKDKKCKKSKHKKHKSRHKSSSKKSRSSTRSGSDSSTSSDSESSDGDPDEIEKRNKLETLRAERLRREKAERERTNQLLYKTTKPEPKVETDDRKRSYNSQFNPHLARQNVHKQN